MSKEKVAFVLSSGGSRGALEVGGLLALLECGIRPDLLVGTSVGAFNAAAIATNPTLEGARRLSKFWENTDIRRIFSANYFSLGWRLMSREDSLVDNHKYRFFLNRQILKDVHQFSDIKNAELRLVAVRMDTGSLHIFGHDPSDSVFDAVMASTAIVPFLPPWEYRGHQYIDGAFMSALPIRVALLAKATEIYAIDVGVHRKPKNPVRGMLRILEEVLTVETYDRFLGDLGWSKKIPASAFHYISITAYENVRLWDFTFSKQMIAAGRRITADHIARHDLKCIPNVK